MPGSSGRVAPFLQRLPALSAGQKAAAVNLGIFPDSGDTAHAYAPPPRAAPSVAATSIVSVDRLAEIDTLLRGSPPSAAPRPAQPSWQPPQTVQRTAAAFQPKIWLQLARGSDVDTLSDRFRRIKSDNSDLFNGIRPYVARSGSGALLLIGPFRGASDAQIFSEDLGTVGVPASKYINSQTDRIAPLAAE